MGLFRTGNLFMSLQDRIKEFRLKNGLTVIFCENHRAPVASVQFWIRSGSIHEGHLLGSGMSHALEHMLFKGTEKLSAEQFNEAIDRLGGESNAYTTWDRTVYTLELPAGYFTQGFGLLADMVIHPALRKKDFILEKNVILREMAMYEDLPDERLLQNMFETVFAGHPYHVPVLGYPDLFQTLKIEDLKNYHTDHYRPDNAFVVICGAVDEKAVLDAISILEPWKRVPRESFFIMKEGLLQGSRSHIAYGNSEMAYGTVAWKTPDFSHEDSPALEMLADLIGGSDSSYFQETLVDREGLVSDVDAQAWKELYTGCFTVDFTADSDYEPAVASIFGKLKCIRKIPKLRERLATVKALKQANFIRDLQTTEKQAEVLGEAFFFGGSISHADYWQKQLNAVSVDDLVRVSEACFSEDRAAVLAMLPESQKKTAAKKKKVQNDSRVLKTQIDSETSLVYQPDYSLPYVNFRLYCPFGSLHDPAEKTGLGKLLSTLWAKDNRHWGSHDFSRKLESFGAEIRTNVGYDGMALNLECPSRHFPDALEVLWTCFEPRFLQSSFEREKRLQMDAIKEETDDLSYYGLLKAEQLFFGSHPMRLRPIGSESTVKQILRKDVMTAFRERVGHNTLVPFLIGDCDDKLISRIKQLWKQVPDTDATVKRANEPRWTKGKIHTVKLPREQTVVVQTYPFPARSGESLFVAELLVQLLSSPSAPLFKRVREESGLAYFAQAVARASSVGGVLHLLAGTEKKHAKKVASVFSEEIGKICAGNMSAEALDIAKKTYCSNLLKQWQTLASRTSVIQNYVLLRNRWDSLETILDEVNGIRQSDVRALAERFLDESGKQLLLIGNV